MEYLREKLKFFSEAMADGLNDAADTTCVFWCLMLLFFCFGFMKKDLLQLVNVLWISGAMSLLFNTVDEIRKKLKGHILLMLMATVIEIAVMVTWVYGLIMFLIG